MVQISKIVDQQLNNIAERLLDAQRRKTAAEKDYEAGFAEAFKLFDLHGFPGAPARFLAKCGKLIERRVSDPEPRLSVEKLKQALEGHGLAGKRLWNEIAEPRDWNIDFDKLQRAIERKRIPADLVSECIEKPKSMTSRWLRDPAKADVSWLTLLSREDRAELPPAVAEFIDNEEAS